MPKLSFSLDGFKTDKFKYLDLPIDVRKPNMALVARALSSQEIDVAPGQYFVSATLPAGQQITSTVELKQDDVRVPLSPDAEDESPHEFHEHHHYLSGHVALTTASVFTSAADSRFPTIRPRPVTVATVTGPSPTTVTRDLYPWLSQVRELDHAVQFDYFPIGPHAPEGSQRYLEVLQPDGTATRIALPASQNMSCFVVLKAPSPSVTSADVHLYHTEADLLLRNLSSGENALLILDSTKLKPGNLLQDNAEEMVRQKTADPIAACVGAYALLQYGELDRLHNWTENLKNWFTWLPDGLAIRGEHLARLGKHDEAMRNFTEITQRGIPFFRDGLSYAVERLRMYLRSKKSRFADETLALARQTFGKLQTVITSADLSSPILTLRGLTPTAQAGQQSQMIVTINLAPSLPQVELNADAATEAGAGAA